MFLDFPIQGPRAPSPATIWFCRALKSHFRLILPNPQRLIKHSQMETIWYLLSRDNKVARNQVNTPSFQVYVRHLLFLHSCSASGKGSLLKYSHALCNQEKLLWSKWTFNDHNLAFPPENIYYSKYVQTYFWEQIFNPIQLEHKIFSVNLFK